MPVPDDVDFAAAVDRQRRVVSQGVDRLVHPAGAAVRHIMDAPVVADAPVELLNIYKMLRPCRVDDQTRRLVDIQPGRCAVPDRGCAGSFNATPDPVACPGARQDPRRAGCFRYPGNRHRIIRRGNRNGRMIRTAR